MNLNELLNKKEINIPLNIDSNKLSISLRNSFNKYLTLIKLVQSTKVDINLNITDIEVGISEKLATSLISVLETYLSGNILESYKIFEKCIKDVKTQLDFFMLSERDKGSTPIGNFYKLRPSDKSKLERKELFHVPLSDRKKVKSYRFSVPGLPALYLGASIYICWEELSRKNLNDLHAAEFDIQKGEKISLLNIGLSPKYICELRTALAFGVIDDSPASKTYLGVVKNFLLLWPLIAACHIRVTDKDKEFKPEYIIPQMLMQFVANTNNYDGIIYMSTKIDIHSISSSLCRNIAMPVKEQMKKSDYCIQLKRKWILTAPLPLNLFLASYIPPLKKYGYDIELIEGLKTNYKSTQFGSIETELAKAKKKTI